MKRSTQRNLSIDLMKFLYAWCVIFYHYYSSTHLHFKNGRYAVEFFLLAAGVFFFRAWERDEQTPPQRYIFKRFFRFLPWTTTAFIFTFIVRRIVIAHNTPRQLIDYLSKDIWEILLVKMNGLNNGAGLLNSPAWTISTMFLVEIVMLGCLFCNKKVTINVLIPLSLIIGFGFWRNTDKAAVENWVGFTTFGMIRTWLVYSCAYYCMKLADYMRRVRFNWRGRAVLTTIESLCHLFVLMAMLFVDTRYWQWCTLLAFMIAVSIALSGHSLWEVVLERFSGAIRFLGAFSMSIYLTHRPLSRYFEYIYKDNDALYAHVGQYVVAAIFVALLHYWITTGMIRFWRANSAKIKALFIEAA